jgi:hypothetical protein
LSAITMIAPANATPRRPRTGFVVPDLVVLSIVMPSGYDLMHAHHDQIDDQLLLEVKRLAADSGRTLSAVIEEAIRASLARREGSRRDEPVSLPTFRGGGGVRPGVDLSNNAALLDVMERPPVPR